MKKVSWTTRAERSTVIWKKINRVWKLLSWSEVLVNAPRLREMLCRKNLNEFMKLVRSPNSKQITYICSLFSCSCSTYSFFCVYSIWELIHDVFKLQIKRLYQCCLPMLRSKTYVLLRNKIVNKISYLKQQKIWVNIFDVIGLSV